MKIKYENNVADWIKKVVRELIEEGGYIMSKGNIIVEEVDEDSIDCYDDDSNFIKKYRKDHEIYIVSQSVFGEWEQPLTMIAVKS